jgi:hypothetical protein
MLKGEGLFSRNKIIPELVERQHLSNFVRQTRMATAVSKLLHSCLLSARVEGTGSCRKHKDTLLWRQKPLPLEPQIRWVFFNSLLGYSNLKAALRIPIVY